jgi:integrase
MQSPVWAESTRVQRKHSLNKWVRPYIGKVRLYDLGTKRVGQWRSEILAAGASASVVNHAQAYLSAALGHAVKLGDLPANPCRVLEPLPTVVERLQALTPEQVEQIAAAMPGECDRVLVYLLAYAGLRPGEALALTWDDVSGELLIIDKSWSYGKLKRTKTEKARTVEIVAPLAEDLAAYRPARPERGALVIPNADGGHLEINNWRNREWKQATEKAGITATPYDLRHSFGSLLIHEGRSVPVVAALMGHSRPSTTLDTYSHEFHQHRLGTGVRMVDAITTAAGCAPTLRTHPAPASPSGTVMLVHDDQPTRDANRDRSVQATRRRGSPSYLTNDFGDRQGRHAVSIPHPGLSHTATARITKGATP